jgi:molybdopterin converting factor small subunit
MLINIQYYAILREQSGRSTESLETRPAPPPARNEAKARRYPFTLQQDQLKVAINGEFADFARKLRAGDAVVFIPPVAGG